MELRNTLSTLESINDRIKLRLSSSLGNRLLSTDPGRSQGPAHSFFYERKRYIRAPCRASHPHILSTFPSGPTLLFSDAPVVAGPAQIGAVARRQFAPCQGSKRDQAYRRDVASYSSLPPKIKVGAKIAHHKSPVFDFAQSRSHSDHGESGEEH